MILEIISLSIGTIGVIFGLLQYHNNIKLKTVLITQLSTLMNRIRVMVPYRVELEKLVKGTESLDLHNWIWRRYKGLSDLYADVVSYYVSFEKRITYNELKKYIKAGVIQNQWEERVWRDIISLRPENKKNEAPPLFIQNNDTNKNTWS